MNWGSELVRRAIVVVKGLAFEVDDSEEFGMRIIVVTDCVDELQKGIYMRKRDGFLEKMSTFRPDARNMEVLEMLNVNWPLLEEKYYE